MTNATTAPPGWESTTINVKTTMVSGARLEVEKVPALRRQATGEIFYDPADALRMHYNQVAAEAGLETTRDFALLVTLGAPVHGAVKADFTPYHYHLNKMLFYQWKTLEDEGLADAFPHDEFVAERKGPVPANIGDDLERLEGMGLLQREWPEGTDHKPVPVRLTKKGTELASHFWKEADDWLRKATEDVKTELILLSPKQVKDRVHEEWPEYRRAYVEVDSA